MIIMDEQRKIFMLHTHETTYAMAVPDGRYLCHLYYGAHISDGDILYLLRTREAPYTPAVNPREKVSFFGKAKFEYPCFGTGDFRESCLKVRNASGQYGAELFYKTCRIFSGKKELEGLPSSFGDTCETLEIDLEDPALDLVVTLSYSVFEDSDVIVRSARITNTGQQDLYLYRALSACLELDDSFSKPADYRRDMSASGRFDVLSFQGAWAREHVPQRQELGSFPVTAEALRGEGGHEAQPFLAAVTKDISQERGEVYAMHFVYSGNFLGKAARDSFGQLRMVMGIHPETFVWKIEHDESFTTPEVVLTYSSEGLGKMTRTLHDFYREHLIRSTWKYARRPILLNSWEAAYFDFDSDRLMDLAKLAYACRIDLLVVDDGWFSMHRDSPQDGLGDWFVNKNKLKGGFTALSTYLHEHQMRFGLWFEPEMVSPNSELFRKHPDWILQLKDRTPGLCRGQWVLDFSNPEVITCLFEQICAVIREYQVDYIKWDMNRPLCDIGSAFLPDDRQGELWHRHVLGLYRLQEMILKEFPSLLLENCSSGGARFDPGMLYYSPQIWCSDDMDPVMRTQIHEGTAMLYPLSCIGSHVCKEKNDITGRKTPFATRAISAMTGTFGYELDITALPEEEREQIPKQISEYSQISHLIQKGDYYRLSSAQNQGDSDIFEVLAKDKSEGYVMVTQILAWPNKMSFPVRLQGLDPESLYEITGEGLLGNRELAEITGVDIWGLAVYEKTGDAEKTVLHGDTLMQAGYMMRLPMQDFAAVIHKIRKLPQ